MRRRLGAWLPPALVAAVQLSIHLALAGAYGLHTDELYYIVSGWHPALGYVDFPPITPLLAGLDTRVFGVSAWTLRLLPAITSSGMVLLTGLSALELGASRWTATLAALVALLSPYLLATWLFQTVEFDQFLWLLAIYLFARLLRTREPRLFVAIGLVLGIGLETKTTIVVLGAAVVVAVLVSLELRPLLRAPYPWIGALLAAALAAPNLAWQVANGFPTLTYIANHHADIAQSGGGSGFIALFVLVIGPVLLPLWIAGLVLLLREPRWRPLAAVVLVPVALFVPVGKAYYPAPVVPFALAAGCVAAGRLASTARRNWAAGLVLAAAALEAALLSPIILPLVPPAAMHRSGIDKLNPDFANTVGWQDMTSQVAAVFNALPPQQRRMAAIMTSIDGQAGAIDIYGPADHLPQAISPHLSFWYWRPAAQNPSTIVAVGYSPADLEFLCGSIRQAATVTIPYSIDNLDQGAPILICGDLREPLGDAWQRLRNFS